MTSTIRAAAGAAAVAVVAALSVVLPVTAAHAATTYTWVAGWDANGAGIPGADHKSWDIAANWSPAGVPGPADAVVLTNAPATHGFQSSTELHVPAAGKTVASLRIARPEAGSVRLLGGSVAVTGAFDWTGGEVLSPLRIASGAHGRVGAGELKPLRAPMTVAGTLTLDNLGGDVDTELQVYPDTEGDDDGITVTSGGTLAAEGANLVGGTGCCLDPARIVNRGTIEVTSGHTTFTSVEVDQRGTVEVAPGARLTQATGPARLGAGASYRGGGTVEFVDTAAIRSHPDTVPVPGGILVQGTGTLADNTRLLFGAGAKVTGVGGFTGTGLLDFDAAANEEQQSATVYGDLTTGATTRVRFAGAHPARLASWDPDLAGYHGILRLGGAASLAAGRGFVPAGGTVTTVKKGGRLDLAPRSTWGGGDCCTQPARLTVAKGGTLALAGGKGANPKVVRTDLRLQGTLTIAAGKRLVTRGFPARVGGTLKVTGRTKPGRQRTVLTADRVKGAFGCVRPGGQLAVTRARAVTLTGITGRTNACVRGSGTMIATATVKGHKTLRARATRGIARTAKKVVVALTVSKVRKTTKVKVGGAAVVRAPKGKTTTRYLVATRAKRKFVTVRNLDGKPIRVQVVLLGRA